jgi:hypothetical protein
MDYCGTEDILLKRLADEYVNYPYPKGIGASKEA